MFSSLTCMRMAFIVPVTIEPTPGSNCSNVVVDEVKSQDKDDDNDDNEVGNKEMEQETV